MILGLPCPEVTIQAICPGLQFGIQSFSLLHLISQKCALRFTLLNHNASLCGISICGASRFHICRHASSHRLVALYVMFSLACALPAGRCAMCLLGIQPRGRHSSRDVFFQVVVLKTCDDSVVRCSFLWIPLVVQQL